MSETIKYASIDADVLQPGADYFYGACGSILAFANYAGRKIS